MGSYDTARQILQRADPSAALRPQPSSDWQGSFPLPTLVAEYFAQFGPDDLTIDGYGNPYFLPRLAQLWAYQVGYRTHGVTHERLTNWDDDWLVIADEGGNPFIFSRGSGAILHAVHGAGVWEPSALFPNLCGMAGSFAILGDIVASAGQSLTDDDFLLREGYLEEAVARIAEFTASQSQAAIILSTLGWSR